MLYRQNPSVRKAQFTRGAKKLEETANEILRDTTGSMAYLAVSNEGDGSVQRQYGTDPGLVKIIDRYGYEPRDPKDKLDLAADGVNVLAKDTIGEVSHVEDRSTQVALQITEELTRRGFPNP